MTHRRPTASRLLHHRPRARVTKSLIIITAPLPRGAEHQRPPSPDRHAPHIAPRPKPDYTLTHVSSPTHASSYNAPYRPIPPPPMNDANFSRTSPPARTSSLADLVHRTETNPTLPRLPRPHTANSDDGSQQERNHQRPPISNLPRLPPPGDVSRTARNTPNADTSLKHAYRKRNISHVPPNAPDLSSLTQKPEDHASSVAHHPSRLRASSQRPDQTLHPQKPLTTEGVEGSTELLPTATANQQSPTNRRRSLAKDTRTDLLEENRTLRIELDHIKYKLRKFESIYRKQKKEIDKRDLLLAKYRTQLVGLFETGDDDLFRVNKPRPMRASSRSPENRDKDISKIEGESISRSHDEEDDWSLYSAPSDSYEHVPSEDRKRSHERNQYGRSEDGIRKHRRARAPAWTPHEEERFMEAYAKHGCRWKNFQDALPGRSRRQIQSHGSYLIRQGKLLKKNSRPWQRRKPVGGAPSSSMKDVEVEMEEGERSDGE